MQIQLLTPNNIDLLVNLEQDARATEPDIWLESFDAQIFKQQTTTALENSLYTHAKCMMCINSEGRAVGRLDFSIASSFAFGGSTQAYVDWVYVLKDFRHTGVAQLLFSHMEAHLKALGITEYFLIAADNSEAQSFYRSIKNAEITQSGILRKTITEEPS